MYLYNVTTMISWSIHEDWVNWMREKHLPEIMAKGCFSSFHFARLLDTDETEGPTYTVQFMAPSREQYDTYMAEYATALRKDVAETWGDNYTSFRSLLQLVN